jgi:hypothetical protein
VVELIVKREKLHSATAIKNTSNIYFTILSLDFNRHLSLKLALPFSIPNFAPPPVELNPRLT